MRKRSPRAEAACSSSATASSPITCAIVTLVVGVRSIGRLAHGPVTSAARLSARARARSAMCYERDAVTVRAAAARYSSRSRRSSTRTAPRRRAEQPGVAVQHVGRVGTPPASSAGDVAAILCAISPDLPTPTPRLYRLLHQRLDRGHERVVELRLARPRPRSTRTTSRERASDRSRSAARRRGRRDESGNRSPVAAQHHLPCVVAHELSTTSRTAPSPQAPW